MDYRVLERIGDFCQEARSLSEIAEHLGSGDRYKMKKKYIDPILGKNQADIENLGNFGLKILGILKAVLVGENPR